MSCGTACRLNEIGLKINVTRIWALTSADGFLSISSCEPSRCNATGSISDHGSGLRLLQHNVKPCCHFQCFAFRQNCYFTATAVKCLERGLFCLSVHEITLVRTIVTGVSLLLSGCLIIPSATIAIAQKKKKIEKENFVHDSHYWHSNRCHCSNKHFTVSCADIVQWVYPFTGAQSRF